MCSQPPRMMNIDVAKILSSDEHAPHPPSFQDLLDGIELRTRNSSSSVFSDSPAHSRHGGSPLHSYVPGKTPTQAPTSLKPNTHTHTSAVSRLNLRCVFRNQQPPNATAASTFCPDLKNLEIVFIHSIHFGFPPSLPFFSKIFFPPASCAPGFPPSIPPSLLPPGVLRARSLFVLMMFTPCQACILRKLLTRVPLAGSRAPPDPVQLAPLGVGYAGSRPCWRLFLIQSN